MSNFVQNVFSEVPSTYELANHVLTLGLDIVWRRRAAMVATAGGGQRWADLCTGTGELAAHLARRADKGTEVYGIDFSAPMLAEARRKPEAKRIRFVVGDIKKLPFASESLDLVTLSFATRNLRSSEHALVGTFAEFHRVLRPGGRFVSVETSRPPYTAVRWCFDAYVRLVVEAAGSRLSGSRTAYAYLARTIPRFYPAQELAEIMRRSGFEEVSFRRMMWGAAAIHEARKRQGAGRDGGASQQR